MPATTATRCICADFPVYVSGTQVTGRQPHDHQHARIRRGQPRRRLHRRQHRRHAAHRPAGDHRRRRRSSSTRWPRACSSTSSTPRPRCAPPRTTARCRSSARTSRPAPTSWATPAPRSTQFIDGERRPEHRRPGQDPAHEPRWRDRARHRRSTGRPASRSTSPASWCSSAPTGPPPARRATRSPADTTQYVYKVVSTYTDSRRPDHEVQAVGGERGGHQRVRLDRGRERQVQHRHLDQGHRRHRLRGPARDPGRAPPRRPPSAYRLARHVGNVADVRRPRCRRRASPTLSADQPDPAGRRSAPTTPR